MKKTESWSIFDFSTLKNDKIATLLSKHNIPLTVEETKKNSKRVFKKAAHLGRASVVFYSRV